MSDRLKIAIPKDKLSEFCVRWNIMRLEVFESALRDDFDLQRSDLDLLFTYHKDHGTHTMEAQTGMESELAEIFSRKIHLTHRPSAEGEQSELIFATSPPIDKVITEGPLLCLDIDGVCAPVAGASGLGAQKRKDSGSTFRYVEADIDNMLVNLSLVGWVSELVEAFARCVWVSTWREYSAHFATEAGMVDALPWPYIFHSLDGVDLGKYSEPKIAAVVNWVAPDVPVAVVDDVLTSEGNWDCTVLFDYSNPPPLLISPDLYLGLTREIVDLLLEYAADPLQDKFRQKKVWSF